VTRIIGALAALTAVLLAVALLAGCGGAVKNTSSAPATNATFETTLRLHTGPQCPSQLIASGWTVTVPGSHPCSIPWPDQRAFGTYLRTATCLRPSPMPKGSSCEVDGYVCVSWGSQRYVPGSYRMVNCTRSYRDSFGAISVTVPK